VSLGLIVKPAVSDQQGGGGINTAKNLLQEEGGGVWVGFLK